MPVPSAPAAALCEQCHQPLKPEYYFCPNCGKKVSEPPLATDFWAQAGLYLFSIVLPLICFLAVSYWRGIAYARSKDPKAQEIGWIAIGLLALSTIITFWLAAVWIQGLVQSATNSINSGIGGL